MIRRSVAVAMVVGGILAAEAHAVDGVIEINQAKAMAGGVTPGDAPGFPVNLSVGGSYRLTSNLNVAAGGDGSAEDRYGIVASPVSGLEEEFDIDLNGFSLIGPVTCTFGVGPVCSPNSSGSGIGISGNGGFRVHDGAVIGFGGDCVWTDRLSGAQIRNLQVKWCQRGIYVQFALVENVTADLNRFQGVNALFSTLRGISSHGNGGDGIVIQGGSLESCSASANTGDGVEDFGSSVIRDCSLRFNKDFGLQCSSGEKCGYSGVTVSNNTDGTVSNGLELGGNVCDGDLTCP